MNDYDLTAKEAAFLSHMGCGFHLPTCTADPAESQHETMSSPNCSIVRDANGMPIDIECVCPWCGERCTSILQTRIARDIEKVHLGSRKAETVMHDTLQTVSVACVHCERPWPLQSLLAIETLWYRLHFERVIAGISSSEKEE